VRDLPRPARGRFGRARAGCRRSGRGRFGRARSGRGRSASASLALLLAALCAVALGCQESGFDERKETSKPLKVQHVLGESKVPGQAEQPMTLTVDTLDDTVALGLRPARAAVPGARLPAYLREPATGVSLMQPLTATGLAAVEAVHADLIIGSDSQARFYNDLSRLAPTVMIDSAGGQWKLNLRLVGEALGRTNDAEQLLTEYDREAALTRRAIRRAGRTGAGGKGGTARTARPRVAVARLTAGGLRFAKRDSFAGTILSDAGVTQVTRDAPEARIDVMLLSMAPDARRSVDLDGRFERVSDALWWGSGGALAAKAALGDLKRAAAG
jgi:iron complex transport system substrate-binding protein